MQQHDEHEARDVERELHLDEHPDSAGQSRGGGHVDATEVLAREDQPDRDRDERRHRGIEHEVVQLRDHQRRAEYEDHREQPRGRPEQEPPGAVAAQREQRDEDQVLGDDRRGGS